MGSLELCKLKLILYIAVAKSFCTRSSAKACLLFSESQHSDPPDYTGCIPKQELHKTQTLGQNIAALKYKITPLSHLCWRKLIETCSKVRVLKDLQEERAQEKTTA